MNHLTSGCGKHITANEEFLTCRDEDNIVLRVDALSIEAYNQSVETIPIKGSRTEIGYRSKCHDYKGVIFHV